MACRNVCKYMTNTIHFDPRAARPVMGGVVALMGGTCGPRLTVTITLFDERSAKRKRFGRFAHREVFVPLYGSLSLRQVIDGSYAPEPAYLLAS